MVGQFGRERGMRELGRIDVGLDEGRGLFPNGIVAAHENNAPPHQRRYGIILAGEDPRRVLIFTRIGSPRLLLEYQRIGLDFLSARSCGWILFHHDWFLE